jgi:WhiB family redox-sensing transcriptional regulator
MSTSDVTARPARKWPADWRDHAACRDADPELFFAEGDDRSGRAQVTAAKLICRSCPLSATCLNWALASGHEAGIRGGLTENERRELHRWSCRSRSLSTFGEESHDHNLERTALPAWHRRI